MADLPIYYSSKAKTNFPSPTSVEHSRTQIALYITCLVAKYLHLEQSLGKEYRLVCDLSHNNLTFEHLQYLTESILASPVQLFALDLSCNYIITPAWSDILPLVKQLLTKATYLDLACNFLPNIYIEPSEMKDILQQNVSFTAPNLYLGSTPWMRHWTSKAHEFRRQAYRSAFCHTLQFCFTLQNRMGVALWCNPHRSECYSAAFDCCA